MKYVFFMTLLMAFIQSPNADANLDEREYKELVFKVSKAKRNIQESSAVINNLIIEYKRESNSIKKRNLHAHITKEIKYRKRQQTEHKKYSAMLKYRFPTKDFGKPRKYLKLDPADLEDTEIRLGIDNALMTAYENTVSHYKSFYDAAKDKLAAERELSSTDEEVIETIILEK